MAERRGGDGGRRPRRRADPAVPGKIGLPPDVVEDVRGTARRGAGEEVVALLADAVRALERGQAEVAARAAGQAKGLAPRTAAVREVLGIALYQAERFREALRELQAYRRLSGRLDQNYLIADCQRALESPDKAVATVRDALAARLSEEVRAETAIVGGAALADLGRFEESLALLRRFQTRPDVARPHDLRIWYVLGDVLERAGQPREAAAQFRKVVRHDPDAFDAAERLAALA